MTVKSSSQLPNHWDLLNHEDQEQYTSLQKTLSSPACKNRRNRSKQTFSNILSTIKNFVIRNDEDDISRSLVCGIGWIPNGIAINTRQLRLLIAKCKSSINGSFHALGFSAVPTSAETASVLSKLFPCLNNNFSELRQWSVRFKGSFDTNITQPQPMNVVLPSKLVISSQNNSNNQFGSFLTPFSTTTLQIPPNHTIIFSPCYTGLTNSNKQQQVDSKPNV